ncbi:MAG: tripartite tricarboxylate transporter substrate binding protein [Pigmentiphaga sp.]|nr:tripartite tricarboxylate transporter substrate binding protein [Pigmentiphaga sp.]
MRRQFLTALALSLGLAAGLPAQAAEYPNKPIDMVVPFPAGTGTDMGARLLAHHLQTALGQTVVVNNRPGAGGAIGAMEVVRAAPDGYTLLFASNSPAAANVALFKSIPYDPATDLTPIAGVAESALVLMVPAEHPAQNLEEFLEYVAQRPGKVSAGYGSASSQVSIELLNKMAGLDVLAVPYKGITNALNDTIGGIVDFTFVDMGNAMAQADGGKLRALGVTSPKVSTLRPEWAPLSERFPGFDVSAWLAIFGPAGMPADVVAKLGENIGDIIQTPELRERLAFSGLQPMVMSAQELGEFVQTEIAHWQQMVRDANIEPQ